MGILSQLSSATYRQLLSHHAIYFIAFDQSESVIDSNYPVANLSLNKLDDLIFLIGQHNLELVRGFILHPSTATHFSVANLRFEMISLPSDAGQTTYCLAIQSLDTAQPETKLSSIDQDYKIINELADSLTILSTASENHFPEHLQREIKQTHLPEVEKRLQQIQDPMLKMCLEIVKSNMENLLHDNSTMNSALLQVLTPSELQVAEFIRGGMSSQEIANTLNIAKKTVENHRNSLRNKLGITNRSVNLKNYLLSLEKTN
nr:helix-turn-helix transcriptional regulator [Vibrio rumoiensis]